MFSDIEELSNEIEIFRKNIKENLSIVDGLTDIMDRMEDLNETQGKINASFLEKTRDLASIHDEVINTINESNIENIQKIKDNLVLELEKNQIDMRENLNDKLNSFIIEKDSFQLELNKSIKNLLEENTLLKGTLLKNSNKIEEINKRLNVIYIGLGLLIFINLVAIVKYLILK